MPLQIPKNNTKHYDPEKAVFLDWRGDEFNGRFRLAVWTALKEWSELYTAQVKKAIPVQSGHLRESVGYKLRRTAFGGNKVAKVYLGTPVHYALAVETGDPGLEGPAPEGYEPGPPAADAGLNRGRTNSFRTTLDQQLPNLPRLIGFYFQQAIKVAERQPGPGLARLDTGERQ